MHESTYDLSSNEKEADKPKCDPFHIDCHPWEQSIIELSRCAIWRKRPICRIINARMASLHIDNVLIRRSDFILLAVAFVGLGILTKLFLWFVDKQMGVAVGFRF